MKSCYYRIFDKTTKTRLIMTRRLFLPSFWIFNAFALINPFHIGILANTIDKGENSNLAKTFKALNRIKVDALDTTVPSVARPLLTELKHQLRDLIQKSLNANASQTKDIAKAQTAVAAELERQNIFRRRETIVPINREEAEPYVSYPQTYCLL
jgi:hypothetical protein